MVLTREIRDEIKMSISNGIKSLLKEEDFIKHLVEKVADSVTKNLSTKIAELEQKLEKLEADNSTVIADIKEEMAIMKTENDYLMKKFDQLDQQSRLNNVRIFSLKEQAGEDLEAEIIRLFDSKLDIQIKMEDIVFCKRIGKMRQGKTRGILLKLANTKLKQRVYNSKKRLKGTGVVMKEDLTENKMKLMEAAIEKTSLRDVWSSMGNVFAMKNNVRHLIDSKAALDNL
nr:unnamed protein product [Callosobruchus analis]